MIFLPDAFRENDLLTDAYLESGFLTDAYRENDIVGHLMSWWSWVISS